MARLRLSSRSARRVPPARPRLEQRYVEAAAYRALLAGRITAAQYAEFLNRRLP